MPDSLAALSHAAATQALETQERGIEQIRSRTGTLLAATSLTASFLGAQTISHTKQIGVFEVGALVCFAISIMACVYVLLPKEGFIFSISGPALYDALYEQRADADEMHRILAYWLEEYWMVNQAKAEVLGRVYVLAAFALVGQMLLWSTALASRLG